jgi:ubiquinone/menaquinone biosynthesis C-methylase UbiE
MPVAGYDGKAILDYGCGPGHDVVGFAHFSKTARLIGMDVSTTSLASIDLIHSSGVLHHTPNPLKILKEFRRIIRPGGSAQIMIL